MKKFIILLCLFMFAAKSYGLTLDRVFVFGEDIKSCGLSKEPITASLAGVMRYNRISMDTYADVNVYHQVTAVDLGSSCAASVNLQFYVYETKIFVPSIKKSLSANVVLCNLSMLLTGPKHDMQSRLNENAKSLAEQCLVKIDKK